MNKFLEVLKTAGILTALFLVTAAVLAFSEQYYRQQDELLSDKVISREYSLNTLKSRMNLPQIADAMYAQDTFIIEDESASFEKVTDEETCERLEKELTALLPEYWAAVVNGALGYGQTEKLGFYAQIIRAVEGEIFYCNLAILRFDTLDPKMQITGAILFDLDTGVILAVEISCPVIYGSIYSWDYNDIMQKVEAYYAGYSVTWEAADVWMDSQYVIVQLFPYGNCEVMQKYIDEAEQYIF